jgi:hypothetical protein
LYNKAADSGQDKGAVKWFYGWPSLSSYW